VGNVEQPGDKVLVARVIHPSAWKGSSANFACKAFCEVRHSRTVQISLIWVIRRTSLGVYDAIVTRERRAASYTRLEKRRGR